MKLEIFDTPIERSMQTELLWCYVCFLDNKRKTWIQAGALSERHYALYRVCMPNLIDLLGLPYNMTQCGIFRCRKKHQLIKN